MRLPSTARFIAIVLLWACACNSRPVASRAVAQAPDVAEADAEALFENNVRPLLVQVCGECHGPGKQESGLRLDSREALLRGGDNGPAIAPGQPDESLLVQALRYDGDVRMPPEAPLAALEVAAIVRWIELGAAWPESATGKAPPVATRGGPITDEERRFWSFQPISDPPLPTVVQTDWPLSPLDRFILARLEAAGITPAPPADKRTLLRRASFDLTGMPPTVEELAAFLADDSPQAFARAVDPLLASRRYGERWGRHWLDVVRYADTAGETADYPLPEARLYRDWVIEAVNRDLPYDEFLRQQIAGDILALDGPPERYAERVTATGFLAMSRRFGFDSENYHHLTIQDTIDTLGQAVLGLSLGCARCHDHKYDPVSTADYYALFGIFESTRYAFPGSEQKQRLRVMAPLVPPADAVRLRAEWETELVAAEARLAELQVAVPAAKLKSLADLDGDFEIQAPAAGGSLGVLVAPWTATGEPSVQPAAQSPFRNVYPRGGGAGVSFPGGEGEHSLSQALPAGCRSDGSGVLHVAFDLRVTEASGGQPGTWRIAFGRQDEPTPAVELFVGVEGLFVRDGADVRLLRPLPPGEWQQVHLVIDVAARTFSGVVGTAAETADLAGRSFVPGFEGGLDLLRIDTAGHAAGPRPAWDLDNLAVGPSPLPPHVGRVTAPAAESLADQPPPDEAALAALREEAQYTDLLRHGPFPLAYAVAEGTPHDAAIQRRGEPTKLGDVVPRRFLEILGGDPLPSGSGSGRRELAEWLTRPANPLTARVLVNRVWQRHFGVGLVATANDFGARGERPSHPELLDWLATRFVEDGWSLKALHRRIVLSRAYQLSATYDADAAGIDPSGRLLWRFPRRRLDAESLRDALLLLGGNLDESSPEAHPFPPPEQWSYTQHNPFAAVYESNRRSVYLMTQRIKRHPYLALFDGADANATTAVRSETTVPTQALFLMNDPFVHEQAAGFARRLVESHSDPAVRLALAYESALGRPPDLAEREQSLRFLDRYAEGLAAAGVPADRRELESWAALARTLFARNEFLFVE